MLNKYLDELRKSQRDPVLVPLPEGMEFLSEAEIIQDPCLEYPDDLARSLPPSMQIVLQLRIKERLSYQGIADRLDIPVGTVMSRLSRARRQLKAQIDQNPSET